MDNTNELITQIYDTLKDNREYPHFDPEKAHFLELNQENGTIDFTFDNKDYRLSLNCYFAPNP
jgi:hypothetical protein